MSLIKNLKEGLVGKYVCVTNENSETKQLVYFTIEDVLFFVNDPKICLKYSEGGVEKYWTIHAYQAAQIMENPMMLEKIHKRTRKIGHA